MKISNKVKHESSQFRLYSFHYGHMLYLIGFFTSRRFRCSWTLGSQDCEEEYKPLHENRCQRRFLAPLVKSIGLRSHFHGKMVLTNHFTFRFLCTLDAIGVTWQGSFSLFFHVSKLKRICCTYYNFLRKQNEISYYSVGLYDFFTDLFDFLLTSMHFPSVIFCSLLFSCNKRLFSFTAFVLLDFSRFFLRFHNNEYTIKKIK
jgi:hypothetical protein